MNHFRTFWVKARLIRYLTASHGNMSLVLAMCALPLALAAGVTIDYSRQMTVDTQYDAIADAVALQAVDFAAMNQNITQAKADAQAQFTAMVQAKGLPPVESVSIDLSTDSTGRVAKVNYTASIPPSFTGMLGKPKLNIAGAASAHSAAPSYLDIFVLADNSPSMGIAATVADQNKQKLLTGGCEFACHISGSTNDYYIKARNNGVLLRIDSVRNAINSLLSTAQAATTPFTKFRFALYTLGPDNKHLGAYNIYALSSDLNAAKTAANGIDEMIAVSSNHDPSSDFTATFNAIDPLIPNSGNGQTLALSRKLLFFVSDGLVDRYKSSTGSCSGMTDGWRCTETIDTTVCDKLKARGITIATIYTTYLPVSAANGWVQPFNAGPYSPSPNSKIAKRMQACGTTGFYQEVGPNDSLAATLNLLFNQFVQQSARITG